MNSLSQGLFVFKHGLFKNGTINKKKHSKHPIPPTKFESDHSSSLWLEEFQQIWNRMQYDVMQLQENNTDIHLTELLEFVGENEDRLRSDESNVELNLRVAAVLTGINKPDHYQYFKLLSRRMRAERVAETIFLPARDCPNVRTAIEILVSSVMNNGHKHSYIDGIDDTDFEKDNFNGSANEDDLDVSTENIRMDDDYVPPVKLRRGQYTLDVLKCWFDAKYMGKSKPKIAIIMPNFEEFKPNIVKDLTLILSNHCNELPLVMILGVATSTSAVMKTLSFTETTRIKLRGFTVSSSNSILNEIHNDIILTPRYPLQLSSGVFKYLKGVFMFYDLTAKNFMKAVHHNMLCHYSQGNAYSLCAKSFEQSKKNVRRLQHADFEVIRRLPSFRTYIDSISSYEDVIAALENNEHLRKQLPHLLHDIYSYFYEFYAYIRFIWLLVKDLPGAPLGKKLSDVYVGFHAMQKSAVTDTEDFQKSWKLLAIMSKDEFINLLRRCNRSLIEYEKDFCVVNSSQTNQSVIETVRASLRKTRKNLEMLIEDSKNDLVTMDENQPPQTVSEPQKSSRQAYFTSLLIQGKQNNSGKTALIQRLLDYVKENIVEKISQCPPLIELFVYSDYEYARDHLRGSPRSAIHMSLANPNHYLQCNCCVLENSNQLIATMPDISIAYKLLLESGQQVNIFDWMTAFNCITNDNQQENGDENDDDNDDIVIPTDIQAKFTRARAELQFLGFTKQSKRKTDHITRTTW